MGAIQGRAVAVVCVAQLLASAALGVATAPSWTRDGDQSASIFGQAVANAGDVNGDGYEDLVVGAPLYDNGQADEGRAYLYLGSLSGPVGPVWQYESNQAGGQCGYAVAGAGDVNGDGYADVLIGIPGYDNGQADEGAMFLFAGGSGGLGATPVWIGEGNLAGARLGEAVAGIGDVNRDGRADLAGGAPEYTNGQTAEGAVFVYHGAAGFALGTAVRVYEGNQSQARLGTAVAAAGDVDGNTYADLIVGAPLYDAGQTNEGRAYVYAGSATGLGTSPIWTAEGNQAGALFGAAVAGLAGFDQDTCAKLAVGASGYDNGEADEGRVFVYFSGSNPHGGCAAPLTTTAWTAEPNRAGAGYGGTLAGLHDVNGDGYGELLVGSVALLDGRVDLFFGRGDATPASSAGWSYTSPDPSGQVGYSVALADVDGDGFGDVLAGAPGYDKGRLVGWKGVANLPAAAPSQTLTGTASDHFGGAVLMADLDQDGRLERLVASPIHPNGGRLQAFFYGTDTSPSWTVDGGVLGAQFGTLLSTPGDVNGDGYQDVLVGSPQFQSPEAAEGRVSLFLGAPFSPHTSAAWTFETNASIASLAALSGPADFNGDGYADLAIGASNASNGQSGEGRVYVFYGGPGGPAAAPDLVLENDQANARFGSALAVCDLNGDGYADLAAGARQWSSGASQYGRVFAYLGGAGGLSASAAWTFTADRPNARLGQALACAEVTGDGYDDLVAAAPGYSTGVSGDGRLFLFPGSATGPSPSAAWQYASDQAGASLGERLVAAGDVDADGFADVVALSPGYITGQPHAGRVLLFRGRAGGLSATPAWSWFSPQAPLTGASLAGGDANGDGFADLLISLPEQGQVHVFHGNGWTGLSRRPRQFSGSGGATVAPWGHSGDADAYRPVLGYSSFLGRASVAVEAEGCPAGTAFGSAACVRASSAWLAEPVGPGATVILSATAGRTYRWRARALRAPYGMGALGVTPPPRPAHTPWFRLAGQVFTGDLRTVQRTDLEVTKSDGLGTSVPGRTITYTIRARNLGTLIGQGRLQDTLPAALSNAGWSCSGTGGATCAAAAGSGGLDQPIRIPAGGQLTYTLGATIASSAVGTLSNTARVVPGAYEDSNPANDTATDSNVLTPLADLVAYVNATPSVVAAWGTVSYAVTVANDGPSDSPATTWSATTPPGFTFVSLASGVGTCTTPPAGGTGTVSCDWGTRPAGGFTSATLVLRAGTLLGNATLTVGAWSQAPDPNQGNNTAAATIPVTFTKGDMNNDGQTDLLLRALIPGDVVAWLMSGTTRAGEAALNPIPIDLNDELVGVDDFNSDRRNDVVFWDRNTGAVEFWLLNGLARPGSAVPLGGATPLSPPWRLSATADFNADGRPDLVWRNSSTQKIQIWTMNGTSRLGVVTPTPDQAVDGNWEIVAAFDWNGDQSTDFLWYNPVSGKIVLWFMNASVVRITGQFTNPANAGDNNWKVLAGGDFGVGASGFVNTKDIVWRNATSGRYVVWHMDQAGNRTAGLFTTPNSPAAPLEWTIVGPR